MGRVLSKGLFLSPGISTRYGYYQIAHGQPENIVVHGLRRNGLCAVCDAISINLEPSNMHQLDL